MCARPLGLIYSTYTLGKRERERDFLALLRLLGANTMRVNMSQVSHSTGEQHRQTFYEPLG